MKGILNWEPVPHGDAIMIYLYSPIPFPNKKQGISNQLHTSFTDSKIKMLSMKDILN